MIPASFFHCFDTGHHVIDIDVFFSFSYCPSVGGGGGDDDDGED